MRRWLYNTGFKHLVWWWHRRHLPEGAPLMEVCEDCWRQIGVGFHVPDEIWLAANGREGGVLCLVCFAARADRLLLPWGAAIQFYPVAVAGFLGPQKPKS